ncbi:MAG: lytic transglycosylase domain-containing protein [Henriciella sp.]|nr:lytic transglycosylase domain-containing protein [Henriciella sp.]
MHVTLSKLIAVVALTPFLASLALAAPTPSAPSLKPALIAASDVISTREASLLRRGLQAVEREDWPTVRGIQKEVRDPTAQNILAWYRARRDLRISFDELNQALDDLHDWPQIREIRNRAEEHLAISALSSAERIEWFESHEGARSGPGYFTYARALDNVGRHDEAMVQIRKAWHGRTLTRDFSQQVMARYGDRLTQDDHHKRADFLLWTRQTSAANRLMSYLSRDWRALTEARILLIRRGRGVDAAIDRVPVKLKEHPGLLFDRAQWRRRSGIKSTVAPLLRQIDGNDVPVAGRERLWNERSLAVRVALKDGDWALAYDLSAPHGLTRGREFAEAEWTAGWIALRHRGDAERALKHFETLEAGVGSPISLSRARYWVGRAHEAMNTTELASAAYRRAAEYPFTYYGQLAAEKVSAREIALIANHQISDADREAFNRKSLVRAMRLFAENGWDAAFRKLAYHLDDQLTEAAQFDLLAELGREYHYSDIGVRGAKAGMAKGVVAPDAAYPLVEYPLLREPRVERSLMLALSRQESEMNPAAISHANARGLMQFVPRTARYEARKQGLPYRTSWLTDDPGYNMTLGGAHLDTLLGQFNGSYIMTAAAYNAGASRPRRWIEEYGDPRAGEVDPVDWVEFIPFSETRNYVQRVLENTQVYRHRLSGEPEDIQLSDDLQRGRFANR